MNIDTKVKEILHISRHWDNPEIKVTLHKEGIVIEVSLEDFCKALAVELGSPTWILSRATLESKLLAAVQPVLNKIKESSNFI